jgi:hypothetical protein
MERRTLTHLQSHSSERACGAGHAFPFSKPPKAIAGSGGRRGGPHGTVGDDWERRADAPRLYGMTAGWRLGPTVRRGVGNAHLLASGSTWAAAGWVVRLARPRRGRCSARAHWCSACATARSTIHREAYLASSPTAGALGAAAPSFSISILFDLNCRVGCEGNGTGSGYPSSSP